MRTRLAAAGLLLVTACAEPPEGLARTPDGDGPEIVFELDRRPLPELPFPNDIATRPDPTSPTGLRINASLVASTQLERTARAKLDELTGFGVYQPITVRFDAPLDLSVIYDRHRDYRTSTDGSDYDFSNDAVYVVDVTPDSPTYLQPVPLDFGEGNFPQLLRTPNQYWEHDPKTITTALAYETYNEDWNDNGILDPGEDLDLDGVLDTPNYDRREDNIPSTLDVATDLVTFYEFETDTLIFKPIVPLREGTTYAVVVTNRLTDEGGEPVRSPFPYVNHAAQTDDLEPVLQFLDEQSLGADDIAFSWSFTTQQATGDMVAMRDGLYGEGDLAWLAEDNPPALTSLLPMRETESDGSPVGNAYILPTETITPLLGPLANLAFGELGVSANSTDLLVRTHDYYGYHVSGTFKSPWLLGLDEDARNLDEESWPMNLADPRLRGEVEYRDVQFWCVVPKKEYLLDPTKPAPVVLYAHGYTSNKIEQLGLALHAKFGIAGCSIDAVGHGVDVGDATDLARNLFASLGAGPAADALLGGRIEDVDGDGQGDVGGEFFTGYMFKTRDNLRQTLTDWLTLVRLLRRFGVEGEMLDIDGDGSPDDITGDGVPEMLGDFDGDGIADLGGPTNVFFASGTSLGGLISSMLAALEPTVVAAAPISGGAGLIDLTLRSEQGGVVEAVGLRLMGPLIMGEPTDDGRTRIYQAFPNGNQLERRDLAVRVDIEPGNVVMATNRATGESRCAMVMPNEPPPGYENYRGWPEASNCSANDAGLCRTCPEGTEGTYACDLAGTFRVGVPSDKDDPIEITVFEGPFAVEVEGDARDCFVVGDPEVRTSVDTFEFGVEYRGTSYAVGDALVALEDGYGFQRGTPLLRRFLSIAGMAIEGADPALYAPHYSIDPFTFREDGETFQKQPTNVLNVGTVGDPNVPINTGIAIAKAAGFVNLDRPDERYRKPVNRVLIDEGVQAGVPWLYTRGVDWGPALVDVDNLSGSFNGPMTTEQSVDGLIAPRLDPALRIVVRTPGTDGTEMEGFSALVLPMINEFNGAHGFSPPGMGGGPFDIGQYMEHQIGLFFRSAGKDLRYDLCMAQMDACPDIPSPPPQ
ncbi:MAG: hypothetical protein AAGA54_19830 [Myxococcota bacterium]